MKSPLTTHPHSINKSAWGSNSPSIKKDNNTTFLLISSHIPSFQLRLRTSFLES
ncbi:MAG: hypothetical protein MUC80_06205 [Candidatus Thermoplasmatota archaeon]|nr:hypothetical protein [Candidatus Thermoplasmatota archaeon]